MDAKIVPLRPWENPVEKAKYHKYEEIARLVDTLMRRSPALDRCKITDYVIDDLRKLEKGRNSEDNLHYNWTVENGVLQVSWPS